MKQLKLQKLGNILSFKRDDRQRPLCRSDAVHDCFKDGLTYRRIVEESAFSGWRRRSPGASSSPIDRRVAAPARGRRSATPSPTGRTG